MQNMKAAVDHLKTHHTKWPATYEELVAECNNLSDFSEEDKKEFMDKLPKKTYNSADEVMAAMGWSGEGAGAPPAEGQSGDMDKGGMEGGMGGGTNGNMGGGQTGQGGMGGQPPAQGGQPGQGGQM